MALCLLSCILSSLCILVLDVLGEELLEKVVSSCYDMLVCYLTLPTENNCIPRMSGSFPKVSRPPRPPHADPPIPPTIPEEPCRVWAGHDPKANGCKSGAEPRNGGAHIHPEPLALPGQH